MDASVFVRQCEQAGIGFFCGVPDSIVGPLSSALTNSNASNHHIATHEGNAIGMALGYFAVSEEPALVYMQNSGLGNAVDPLTSLADKAVFGVPMVLLIGWRGEPGTDDEPQHEKPGAITLQLLELLGIESVVLTGDVEKDGELIMQMIELTKKLQSPVALVVKRGYFNTVVPKEVADEGLMREAVLKEIIASIPRDSVVVANIGKTSRELYELREATSTTHDRDLLIVGGMGHASSIALTIAKYSKLNKAVYCIDGDGSVLMHMGALASIGHDHTQLTHILLNNGVYDSVGGQPSGGKDVDFCKVAIACGYTKASNAKTLDDVARVLERDTASEGPEFIEVQTIPGSRPELGRPTTSPAKALRNFIQQQKIG